MIFDTLLTSDNLAKLFGFAFALIFVKIGFLLTENIEKIGEK